MTLESRQGDNGGRNGGDFIRRVHMNVVPRSTMNTNGETEN